MFQAHRPDFKHNSPTYLLFKLSGSQSEESCIKKKKEVKMA